MFVEGGAGQGDLMSLGYLGCSGLLNPENQCLQLLACHYTRDRKAATAATAAANATFSLDSPVQRDVTSM